MCHFTQNTKTDIFWPIWETDFKSILRINTNFTNICHSCPNTSAALISKHRFRLSSSPLSSSHSWLTVSFILSHLHYWITCAPSSVRSCSLHLSVTCYLPVQIQCIISAVVRTQRVIISWMKHCHLSSVTDQILQTAASPSLCCWMAVLLGVGETEGLYGEMLLENTLFSKLHIKNTLFFKHAVIFICVL